MSTGAAPARRRWGRRAVVGLIGLLGVGFALDFLVLPLAGGSPVSFTCSGAAAVRAG